MDREEILKHSEKANDLSNHTHLGRKLKTQIIQLITPNMEFHQRRKSQNYPNRRLKGRFTPVAHLTKAS
jgi:hypothetical protein